MSAEKYLLEFVRKHGVRVISDGDWDGILASAILVKWLKERGFECSFDSVDFPKPRDLVEMKVGGVILIELPPSRGYTVVKESLLFDHHAEAGLFLVAEDGGLKALVKTEPYPSVARLVLVLLDINLEDDWKKIFDAVDLIDLGESLKDDFAWTLHKAYLANTDSSYFRKTVFRMLVEDKLSDLISYIEEEAKMYDRAREKISLFKSRTKVYGEAAFFWYNPSDKFERMVYREYMFELEKKYKLVVAIALRSDKTIEKMHLGSYEVNVSKLISDVLEYLKKHGVTGGGKDRAGGIQFPILTLREADIDKIGEVIQSILSELK